MLGDLRHAVRTLARAPGYAATVVLTLALGIGGTTAVLSVLRSVVLRPLPSAPTDRVMFAAELDSAGNQRLASYPTFEDWRAGANAFEAMAFARGLAVALNSGEGVERLTAAFVTDSFFRVLAEPALLGRALEPADWNPGAPGAVVLSYRLWQRRFGGDPRTVGTAVTLGERSYTVVGIMPRDYVYPTWAEVYAPISAIAATDPALRQRGVHADSRVVVRLRPGLDSAAGASRLSAVAARLARTYPAENGGWGRVTLTPVADEILGAIGPQLRLLATAAVFVLLIACVNIANLSLARASARSRELAIRTALGGGRLALLRTLAAESVVLGVAAGALGLGLAAVLVRWIRVAGYALLPRVDELAVDPGYLLLSVAGALAIVVGLGLFPAIRRTEPLPAEFRHGHGAGERRRRLRAALVVGEFALALMLLAGAGLLVRSLLRLQQVRSGLDHEQLIAVPVTPPSPRYDAPERALGLYEAALEAVAAVPGVRSAALTNHVPLTGASMTTPIEIDGVRAGAEGADEVLFREVDAGYFRTAGVPVVMGRGLTPEEVRHPGDAVLVNEALARRYWPGRSAVGRHVTVVKSAQGRPDFGEPFRGTVVGVVGNVRHYGLETDFVPEVYVPYTVTVWPRMSILARVEGDPSRLVAEVERAVRRVEPDLPLRGASLGAGVYLLQDLLRESLAYRRFLTGLLVAFAVPALLLAALGIYGVVAYLVSRRTREIGIRMALGAQQGRLLWEVLSEGMRLTLLGVGLGAVGAALTTRWLQAQLYEVTATDPVAFVGAAAILVVVGALAIFIPARRATRIAPTLALQSE